MLCSDDDDEAQVGIIDERSGEGSAPNASIGNRNLENGSKNLISNNASKKETLGWSG